MWRYSAFWIFGWFSAVIGFETKPIYGYVVGIGGFIILLIFVTWLDDRAVSKL